jgi:hypothetical protein
MMFILSPTIKLSTCTLWDFRDVGNTILKDASYPLEA